MSLALPSTYPTSVPYGELRQIAQRAIATGALRTAAKPEQQRKVRKVRNLSQPMPVALSALAFAKKKMIGKSVPVYLSRRQLADELSFPKDRVYRAIRTGVIGADAWTLDAMTHEPLSPLFRASRLLKIAQLLAKPEPIV